MLHEAIYYYYGSIIPIAEVSSKMYATKDLRKDIYCYIFNNNLQYRRVGNVRTTWRIIVGYELKYFTHSSYDVNKDQYFLPMLQRDIPRFQLKKELEAQVMHNLFNIGCKTLPKYWVVYNQYYDGIDEDEMLQQYIQEKLKEIEANQ